MEDFHAHKESKEITGDHIYVASVAPLKIEAVREGLGIVWPGQTFVVTGISIPSGVAEAPYGVLETSQGVSQRLARLLEMCELQGIAKPTGIAIESGMVPIGEETLDIAFVAVQTPAGKQSFATSPGIVLPKIYIEEARRRGLASTTVGKVMADMLGDTRLAQDPHFYLTGGQFSRQDLIRVAVVSALSQLLERENNL